MAQSGLLIPAAEGSRVAVFRTVEVDIGDDQSLDSSLSTFSSHLRNVIDILGVAGKSTLVLLDELATGTDPGEGVGLSIAVLEELFRRGSIIMATTHFNEIKEYARVTAGFQNARMAFDEVTLRPMYRLDMGEAGNSYAFVIAGKLGISAAIIERARTIAESLKAGRSTAAIPALTGDTGKVIHTRARHPKSVATKGKLATGLPETKINWAIGDVVFIPNLRKSGVIYRLPDERGNMIVQVQKEKLSINHKRVRRYIEKEQLYPGQDYDMDIVFEPVEHRKKRKLMSKRHVEGVTIEKPSED
jgi:dsDNA-specific endonuclease/ATPase MutS2